MAHFIGLDVPVKETSVCVIDDAGKVILEVIRAQSRHLPRPSPDARLALDADLREGRSACLVVL